MDDATDTGGVPLTGTLEETPLPEILEHLIVTAATGTLALSQGSLVKAIFIQKGEPVFATSTIREDRLGENLVRHGIISESAHEAATKKMKETGNREGETLVEMGVLTPKGLFDGLRLQVEEIIISVFLWETGKYQFVDEQLPTYITLLPIKLEQLLPRAMERISSE